MKTTKLTHLLKVLKLVSSKAKAFSIQFTDIHLEAHIININVY